MTFLLAKAKEPKKDAPLLFYTVFAFACSEKQQTRALPSNSSFYHPRSLAQSLKSRRGIKKEKTTNE